MIYVRIIGSRYLALDNNGVPYVGAKLYTCTPATTTLEQTWSDRGLTALNTNPIILDSRGQAQIYTDGARKLILCIPSSTGPTNGVVTSDDYIGEQTENTVDIATTTAGTTNNNYVATVTPPYTSLADGFLLSFKPDVTNTDTVGTESFSGAGKNDIVIQGPYTGTTSGSVFTIVVESNGTPDTIKWRKDAGAYVTGVALTGAWQNLIEGIKFKCSELTGHTIGNSWSVTVVTPAKLNFCSLGNWLIYKNEGGTLSALDGGDLIANSWSLLTKSGTSWVLNNPATQTDDELTSTSGTRERKQESSDYTLLSDDKGNLIDFVNTTTAILTLNPAAGYNGMFFYVRAGGIGDVTITADGTEKILSEQTPDPGASTYILKGRYGKTIQLQCNGVSWEVLLEPPVNITYKLVTKAMSPYSYTPTPGRRWLVAIPQGGGGGGSSDTGSGYGGAAGGKAIKAVDTIGLTTPVTVTIGAKGTGGALGGHDGTGGGTTSFGTICSATGGTGGTTTAGTPGTGVDGHINKLGNDGIVQGAGGNPVDPYGDANYGGGGACTNPGTDGEDGACWIIEIPDYMASIIPAIFQGVNVWTAVNT